MFWTVISYMIIAAIIIIALTEISKLFGPFGYSSNYDVAMNPLGFNSAFSFSSAGKQSEGFYTPSLFGGTFGAAQQQNTQCFFNV